MMKAQSFSATPTPAEAITPMELTMARITRKEMLTSRSWRAMGVPRARILPTSRLSNRRFLFPMVKGRVLLRITARDKRTLAAWAATVARAAPAAPM